MIEDFNILSKKEINSYFVSGNIAKVKVIQKTELSKSMLFSGKLSKISLLLSNKELNHAYGEQNLEEKM